MRITVCMIFALVLFAASGNVVRGARTESLDEKLVTATEYVPAATAPVDQLIEVARRFKIPMGIEWIDTGAATRDKTMASAKRSVRELIEEIVGVSPTHRIEVVDGLVHIYSPAAAVHPFNFLNIRLNNYSVANGDLFAAEDQLRWAIRFTLEPEKYRNGYAGGYGHGANEVFQTPKFSLSGSDLTIREVLNRITSAQGNALWIATIKGVDLEGDRMRWRQKNLEGEDFPITSAWRFLPLAGIAELAKDHLAIDLMTADLLDQRMATIPVMFDAGLNENSVGTTDGVSSEVSSYSCGASIEKIGKDSITISVNLKVKRKGELEFNVEKTLQVYKNRITEVWPEPRTRIRAYFEREEKP
ncbi:MAG TPA: hypothetical protein VLB68_27725 [Pyrinomonadaceae bacterium]|nr:hypothetical protein [Pyrinomonadaceae bacterium]